MFEAMLTEEQRALRDEVREFVRSVPRQLILDMDADRVHYPRDFVREAGERNLLGLRFPTEYGGRGLKWEDEIIAIEKVGVLGTTLTCRNVNQFCFEGCDLRTPSMYFWMVLLLTRRPNFSSSPRIRSAPQRRFALAIRLIDDTRSSVSGGLPRFRLDLDLRFHTRRNSSRCQRKSVSGCTMTSVSFHVRSLLASNTKSARSRQVSFGRPSCRCSTINCWRRKAFSNTSSDLLRVRSMTILKAGV